MRKHFKYTVFREELYDSKISSIVYQKNYISKRLTEQGNTPEMQHDLLIAWYLDFNEDIPYRATTVLEAKVRWLIVRIYGFVFQKRIICEIMEMMK